MIPAVCKWRCSDERGNSQNFDCCLSEKKGGRALSSIRRKKDAFGDTVSNASPTAGSIYSW